MNTTGIIGHSRQLNQLFLILKSGNIPHTMLFTGKGGIGKKLVARRFLTALFCRSENPPCQRCPDCIQAASGTHQDFIELLPDEKGSISIGGMDKSEPGTVRWLIDRLSKKSISGSYGVLIDGAETISAAGQNALLKTIEEPQAGACIIIITANKSLILPTILSRCMELSFNPLSAAEVKRALANSGASADLDLISQISGGSVETALILSQQDVLPAISALCSEISSYLTQGKSLTLDLATVQKKINMDQLLSLLLNIYRAVLSPAIGGDAPHPYLADFIIPDRQKLIALIKILLALRKGLENNLNIRSALKGMLYDIDRIHGFGLPKLELTE